MKGSDTAISIARPLSLIDHDASAALDRRNLMHAWWRKSSGRSGRPSRERYAGGTAGHDQGNRFRQPDRDHIGGDELAQAYSSIESSGREVDQL